MPNPQHILSNFGFCEYRLDYVDPSFTSPRALVASAIAFAQSMDVLLREPDPAHVPHMLQCMNDYLPQYREWRAFNEPAIRQSLLRNAIARALRLIASRIQPSAADAARDKSIRMALFIGGVDELARMTRSSPELRVVARLTSSPSATRVCSR
jgi:hypothetical protein